MAAKASAGGAPPVPGFGPGSGMDDDVSALGRGSRVWYRQDPTTWVLAELREPAAAAPEAAKPRKGAPPPPAVASITLASGKPVDGVPVTELMPANPEMQATIPDLTQLSYLNEPSILGNLQLRYSQDMIYTCAGPVLIALNPCKELPLYSEEVQHDYKSEQRARGKGGCRG
jgi:myosin-5